MTTKPARNWGRVDSGEGTRATSRFAVEIQEEGDLFPLKIAYFDGQSGMIFLQNGFAARLHFAPGALMNISSATLSCERVQKTPVRKQLDKTGLPDFPGFAVSDVARTASGDRIALYSSAEIGTSFLWKTSGSSSGKKLASLDYEAKLLSYQPPVDSPLNAIDVIGSAGDAIRWQRIAWLTP